MSATNSGALFDSDNFHWEGYLKFRPVYRDNLYDLVYRFHKLGGGSFNLAWDAGCGIGNVAVKLATKFAHVWASDPSPTHIVQARRYVEQFPGHVSLVTNKAEMGIDTADGSLDLFVIAEALHWTDAQAVICVASKKLCPGGTFAAWQYGPHLFFVETAVSQQQILLDRLWHMWYSTMEQIAGMQASRAHEIMATRFACLDFDLNYWQNGRQLWSFCTDRPMLNEVVDKQQTFFVSTDRPYCVDDTEMFRVEADIHWIIGYFEHLYPNLQFVDKHKKDFDALGRAMNGRRFKLAWPGALVLARKR